MVSIAAVIVLAAAHLGDPSNATVLATSEASEMEALFEGFIESNLEEEISLDDSILFEVDSDLQDLEESD